MAEPTNVERLREDVAELLADILPMAMHESCAYTNDKRADPCTHCCDWTEIVERLCPLVGEVPRKRKARCEFVAQVADLRERSLQLAVAEMEIKRLRAALALCEGKPKGGSDG